MPKNFAFFKTTMPNTRMADYYLGCLEGSVYIDFNQSNDQLISLCRISFDGYGCYHLPKNSIALNSEHSQKFIEEITKDELNQEKIASLVIEIIRINKMYISNDALVKYGLIDKE